MPAGGAAAAAAAGYTAGAPVAEAQPAAEKAVQGTGQSMAAGMAAPQSRHYPSVAELEVAGMKLDIKFLERRTEQSSITLQNLAWRSTSNGALCLS